jgi:hypothetical protein
VTSGRTTPATRRLRPPRPRPTRLHVSGRDEKTRSAARLIPRPDSRAQRRRRCIIGALATSIELWDTDLGHPTSSRTSIVVTPPRASSELNPDSASRALLIRRRTLHLPQNPSPVSLRFCLHLPLHKHGWTGGYAEAQADALPENMLIFNVLSTSTATFSIGADVFALA